MMHENKKIYQKHRISQDYAHHFIVLLKTSLSQKCFFYIPKMKLSLQVCSGSSWKSYTDRNLYEYYLMHIHHQDPLIPRNAHIGIIY